MVLFAFSRRSPSISAFDDHVNAKTRGCDMLENIAAASPAKGRIVKLLSRRNGSTTLRRRDVDSNLPTFSVDRATQPSRAHPSRKDGPSPSPLPFVSSRSLFQANDNTQPLGGGATVLRMSPGTANVVAIIAVVGLSTVFPVNSTTHAFFRIPPTPSWHPP